MRQTKIFYLLILISLIFAIGCSKGASNPVQPMDTQSMDQVSSPQPESSRVLLGVYDLTFDPGSMKLELVQARNADMHLNVTTYLFPPKCTDCVQYRIIHYFPIAKTLNVEVKVKNPTTLAAYDLRGIVYGTASNPDPLKQADGYTGLYDIPGGNPLNINPFVAFGKGTTTRKLSGSSSMTAVYHLYFPLLWNVQLAFDASYPSNCEEPYDIRNFYLKYPIYDSPGYETYCYVDIMDWQGDVQEVIMQAQDLSSDILYFSKIDGNLWGTEIFNTNGAASGVYKGLVRAKSSGKYLYQYVDIEIGHYGTIATMVEACNFTRTIDTFARIGYPICDGENAYFVTESYDYPYYSYLGKVDGSTCSGIMVDYYDVIKDYNIAVGRAVWDDDYVYNFGYDYMLFEKQNLGVKQFADIPGNAQVYGIVKEGDTVWAYGYYRDDYRILKFDISDPMNISMDSTASPDPDKEIVSFAKEGKYIYLITRYNYGPDFDSEVVIYDTEAKVFLGRYLSDTYEWFNNIEVTGGYAYISFKNLTDERVDNSVIVLNVLDPNNIVLEGYQGSYLHPDADSKLHLFNSNLYVLTEVEGGIGYLSFYTYDISNPWSPTELYTLDVQDFDTIIDFAVVDDSIYFYTGNTGVTQTTISILRYIIDWN